MNTFYFPAGSTLKVGGPATRYAQNQEAIRILTVLEQGHREPTPEEITALSLYTGWGDSQVLNRAMADYRWTESLDYPKWRAAMGSALNAHYTALPIIFALWEGLRHMGLGKLSRIQWIDPSAGIGHFDSCMPRDLHDKASTVEIEMDPYTAAILKALHPDNKVHAAGFETLELPRKFFDLAMSNIPFGNYAIQDNDTDRTMRASVHDYFFARSLDLLRPGGVIAFITSRYTLDKRDDTVRKWIAERANLLCAVRLPEGTFRQNAGTDVVTDVVFLQRREDGDVPSEMPTWVNVDQVEMPDRHGTMQKAFVNLIYQDHPDWMLGTAAMTRGAYNDHEYTLLPKEGMDVPEALAATLREWLPLNDFRDYKNERQYQPITRKPEKHEAMGIWDVPEGASSHDKLRVAGMREIFLAAKELLQAEIEDKDASAVMFMRRDLNHAYDEFRWRFGPLHSPKNTKMLKGNPALPFLKGLEMNYNPSMNTADKAAIFEHATVRPHRSTTDVSTPRDALLVTLDAFGEVNLAHISNLLHCSEDEAFAKLEGLVFKTPDSEIVTADEYLSGDIREKLAQATAAAELNPTLNVNVVALQAAMPPPLKPSEISVRLGAGWVPTKYIKSFVDHMLPGGRSEVVYVPAQALWSVKLHDREVLQDANAVSKWGPARRHALTLIEDCLNLTQPTVWDEDQEGKRSVNKAETIAAQAKAQLIKAEFVEWIWKDGDRSEHLARIYNERYNTLRARSYEGSHLKFPGLNAEITLKSHQKDAVWRVLMSQATLLGHKVGLGKTLVACAAIKEAKRLDMIRKAVVVVPNHLTAQWEKEALWAYPTMNVLCPTPQDFSKINRGTLLSRIATGDWDMVIVPMSAFKLLPVSAKLEQGFIEDEIKTLEAYLWDIKADKDSPAHAAKLIEKQIRNFRDKLGQLGTMAKDSKDTITFEELGADFLVVDEAHYYKNLFIATKMTRIAGMPNSKSERAFDMYMKVRWLLDHNGRVSFLTGTPVANTLAEVYTQMRYLQFHELEERGISHFDAWAQLFADTTTQMEMTPDGSGFRMNTSLSTFTNLPELVMLWSQVLDAKSIKDTTVERPDLFGGKPQAVQIPATADLKAFVESLARRVEQIRRGAVDPHKDNMLKIVGEGRKAALDLALVVPGHPMRQGGKIDALVEMLDTLYRTTAPEKGTQVVFCDLATPKPKERGGKPKAPAKRGPKGKIKTPVCIR